MVVLGSLKSPECPRSVLDLIERFELHRDTYKRQTYNETQVRREFIDPLFKALEWDIDNEQGHAEAYKDVIHEDAIKVGGFTKAPDYCFRIGGVRKFFVEAKKPAEDIKQKREHAYQLRRYAWTAKLPISILTDFEEFAVFDCTKRPQPMDKASTGRVLYLTFDQYADRWGEIWSRFSKDAILKGAFDEFATKAKRKRGTADVDDEFLKEIESWRDQLARNIALRNPGLNIRELNYAVTKTIDRIIFLRMCEDRGIETYQQLCTLPNGPRIYPRLVELFRRADERYNSGLFHFEHEKDRAEAPDTLTPGLTVDDKVLKDIIKRLYYPECPYEFSVMPPEILGQVYEQFLGKVITLTAGHRAKIEYKPEVKKAGGVYYTPKYIVDYIVEHTVGKLLDGKAPGDVGPMLDQRKRTRDRRRAANQSRKRKRPVHTLRILDPACGSGSFLLGAYQYLLTWHLRWYADNDPESWARKRNPPIYQSPKPDPTAKGPTWRLTVAEKKRILLNNIYGVDIDPQAVEVTKLSLLLRVLEGESQQTLDNQWRLFHERALPDLGNNIKCGNSLIGPDFYENQQLDLFDEEERYRINVFDWQAEFPEIMQSGGFDAVIGNPPYVRVQALTEYYPNEVVYYKQRYKSGGKGNFDVYVLFLERGLELLNPNGKIGLILPHKFFNAKYGQPLRSLVSTGRHLARVVHFGDKQVFRGATTYTALVFLDRINREACEVARVDDLDTWIADQTSETGRIPSSEITDSEWSFWIGPGRDLLRRLETYGTTLGDATARIFQGFKTGADPVFILDRSADGSYYSHALRKNIALEDCCLRPLYKSGEMKRYHLRPNSRVIIFPYQHAALQPWSELVSTAPKTAEYLERCRPLLAERERGRFIGTEWYCYSRSQALDIIAAPKILTADLNPSANYCVDLRGAACFPGGAAGGYGIIPANVHMLYLLGLLNSACVDYYLRHISTNYRGGWYGYDAKVVRRLPIRTIDTDDPSDVGRHDRMVELVQQMLDLHKQLASAKTPTDKTAIQRQIDATDHQIDQLVYELYALTDDEIAIVEESHGL